MAYFSNSSEGMILDEQCARCKLGQKPCPIALVQMLYNYDACDNETATNILETLVSQDGTCQMLKVAEEELKAKNEA